MIEIWKNIAGYEGFYRVSSLGRVRRVGGRVLAFGHNKQGRRQVVLCRDGQPRRYQVHVLVCEAFNGPCPEGLECRHRNGNHLDNCPTNLCWSTHAVNMADTIVHGTSLPGEKSPMAKLTEADVIEIRRSLKPQRALAKLYGVSQPTIIAVQKCRTWRHLATAVAQV